MRHSRCQRSAEKVELSHLGGSSREDARQRCSRVMILAGKPPKSTRMPWSDFSAWKSSSLTSRVCSDDRSCSLHIWMTSTCNCAASHSTFHGSARLGSHTQET